VCHSIAAQWRYCLGIRRQIGTFIQRRTNESETRVRGKIRLRLGNDESPHLVTYRVSPKIAVF
jgi:hypothetical protein